MDARYHQNLALKADPDVAGLGVCPWLTLPIYVHIMDGNLRLTPSPRSRSFIFACLISVGLTLLATFASLLLTRTGGPRGPRSAWPIKSQTLNAMDVVFRKNVCRMVVSWLERRNWDTDVLAACAYDLV